MSTIASTSIASSLASASGLNSGLPISDIISKLMALEKQPIASMQARQKTIQSQKTAYTSVQGKVNDLLVSMKKLTARDFSGNTLFNGMSATSSNSDTATASAAAGASAQTINLEVKSLPSSTKASSTGLVGKFDNSALLSDLGI